jgi:hypothetical protein
MGLRRGMHRWRKRTKCFKSRSHFLACKMAGSHISSVTFHCPFEHIVVDFLKQKRACCVLCVCRLHSYRN